MPLILSGPFYPGFTENTPIYSQEDKTCIQQTVARLLSVDTSAARPGMLLGKIQSGKTKTFLGVISLAFDNGFDIAIILTKGTRALARQTLERVRREYAPFTTQDQVQIYDIMTIPGTLTGYELTQKLIFVAKKQVDNMDRLTKLFRDTYPQLAAKKVLIVDDEADYEASGQAIKRGRSQYKSDVPANRKSAPSLIEVSLSAGDCHTVFLVSPA